MDRITSMTAFTTVVASGSFAAAARRLNMSAAMMTNHVRALEDRLGARLLHRTTRKLSLTEAGQTYFDRVSQILAEIEAADTSIGDLQSTPRGTLRVNVSNVMSNFLVPLFAAFSAAFPEITPRGACWRRKGVSPLARASLTTPNRNLPDLTPPRPAGGVNTGTSGWR